MPELLILSPDYPPSRGGIQILVHRLAEVFEEMKVRIVTLDTEGAAAFDADHDMEIERVAATGVTRKASVMSLNARAVRSALTHRPDVVLSAHIVTSPAAATIRSVLGVPSVQYFHAKEVGAKPGLARFAAHHADCSIVVSRYTRGLVQDVGGDPARLRLIHPGVDLVAPPSRNVDAVPTIVSISRLEDRYKGHDVVMRALPLVRARIPTIRWVVIGDGPLRPSLQRMARALGVADSVEFTGAVSNSTRDDWLARANVFTMPSRLPGGRFAGEGFGIVYLEAGARGVPVVAGNVGGALDAVIDGETGVLVDPTDHVAVADALSTLLLDPGMSSRMGATGRAWAEEHAWQRVGRRVEATLLELCRR